MTEELFIITTAQLNHSEEDITVGRAPYKMDALHGVSTQSYSSHSHNALAPILPRDRYKRFFLVLIFQILEINICHRSRPTAGLRHKSVIKQLCIILDRVGLKGINMVKNQLYIYQIRSKSGKIEAVKYINENIKTHE